MSRNSAREKKGVSIIHFFSVGIVSARIGCVFKPSPGESVGSFFFSFSFVFKWPIGARQITRVTNPQFGARDNDGSRETLSSRGQVKRSVADVQSGADWIRKVKP